MLLRTTTTTRAKTWALAALAVLAGCGDDEPGVTGPDDALVDASAPDASAPDATRADAAAPDGDRPDLGAAPDRGSGDAEVDPGPPPAEDPGPVLSGAEVMARADLFVGTGGLAFGYAAQTPAAQHPRGMVRLGPDTTSGGSHPNFHHFSGYHFDDPEVRGFSHTHFVGTGVEDYGNLRVLPIPGVEPLPADPATGPLPEGLARPEDLFVPKLAGSESARPGRYAVTLQDAAGAAVRAELTATLRGGLHRYTGEGPFALAFQVAASVNERGVEATELTVRPDGSLTGWVRFRGPLTGRERPFTLWFDAVTHPAPVAVQRWDAAGLHAPEVLEAPVTVADVQAGAVLRFDGAAPAQLAVGISYVDAAGARANRVAELGDAADLASGALDFEAVAEAAAAAWLPLFEAVRFAGGTPEIQGNFATALYQSHTMPTRFDDVDGRYRGLDGEVHAGEGFAYYSDLSLWDTFRTLHPWYELVFPELEVDVLHSLAAMGAQAGIFPRWPAALGDSGSMIGTSADMLFAGGAAKNLLPDAFFAARFDTLLATADRRRNGHADYVALGYVPDDRHGGSVSLTVEFAYSDAMLADLAERLGRPEAETLRARSRGWRHHLNPESGIFEPRDADGTFRPKVPTRIYHSGGPYVEGSAWHWRFSAYHEPEAFAAALAEATGNPTALADALGEFFGGSRLLSGRYDPAVPDSLYWHGNQPSLHAVWLWHAAGDSAALADWVRAIQRVVYHPSPTGRPGNDDGGTMSAWYLFAAVGMYPVAGTDRYWLGPPLLPRVTLRTGPGRTLTIEAPGASDTRRYVYGITVDGVPHPHAWIDHATLIGAETLHFDLRSEPPR